MLEADETLRRYGPFLEKIAVDSTTVHIKDNKKNRMAEFVLHEGELYCRLC